MHEGRLTSEELQRAVDERRLLPGEDGSSTSVEDAVHWLGVYTELLDFKAKVLSAAESARQQLRGIALDDTEVDQKLLRAQANRYRVRLEYWSRRAGELADH